MSANGGPAFPRTGSNGVSSPQAGMTLRSYAAIKLRVPYSGIDWLDEMIKKSRLDDFAGQALTGLMQNGAYPSSQIAPVAYEFASVMLAEKAKRESKKVFNGDIPPTLAVRVKVNCDASDELYQSGSVLRDYPERGTPTPAGLRDYYTGEAVDANKWKWVSSVAYNANRPERTTIFLTEEKPA